VGRANGGVALVNGVNLGRNATDTASGGRIFLTNAPVLGGTTDATDAGINATVKNTKIVPYLFGEAPFTTGLPGTAGGTPGTFVTYSATGGLRPLNPVDELSGTLTAGDNISLTAAATQAGNLSVNALRLGATSAYTLAQGGNTLNVASGAILMANTVGVTIAGGTLDFGAQEAVVLVREATAPLTVSSAVTGSGGLTKVGAGQLVLSGVNAFTGALNVAGGTVSLGSASAFPVATATSVYGGSLDIGSGSFTAGALTFVPTGTQAAVAAPAGASGGAVAGARDLLLQAGVLCSDAELKNQADGSWDILGDPTEGALVVVAAKAGIDDFELRSHFRRVAEIPFSSERQLMAVWIEDPRAELQGPLGSSASGSARLAPLAPGTDRHQPGHWPGPVAAGSGPAARHPVAARLDRQRDAGDRQFGQHARR
ncbi:MAG: autotransporter-associated beta strand repeat-containing protein, partial [Vulcanococcus sp.]